MLKVLALLGIAFVGWKAWEFFDIEMDIDDPRFLTGCAIGVLIATKWWGLW